ncbi:MAG: GDP-mannose 4,6-dehydratase [Candidatus Altiarchaeota archaeon]
MRCFVTGCAGFIGSHIVEKLLDLGHEVIGIDCFTDYYARKIKESNIEKAKQNRNFKFIEANILNLNLKKILSNIEYIFHEAAQGGVRKSWGKDFEIYTQNNILATQKLLEACKELKIKKFIYASSSSVYGDVKKFPMKENSITKPISPYGVSKLAAENLCQLYWKNFSVPCISLRYFTVYGPRQRPDMAFHKFIKAILLGKNFEVYGSGEQTRDFTFVSDIVEANILAMNSNAEGEIFNIGGGSRISINEIIKILEEITNRKADVSYIEKQKGDMADTIADISKARKILGYKPKVKIKEGLKKEVEWIFDMLKKGILE